jgi:hypothetical protein
MLGLRVILDREEEGGIAQEKLRVMRQEVTVVASGTFSFATDDQTSIINFKPVSFFNWFTCARQIKP